MLALFHDTIAAISTPEGRSALSIVRISGQDAIGIVSKIVSQPEALWVAQSGKAVYTTIQKDEGGGMKDEGIHFPPSSFIPHPSSLPIDDVVIHVFRAPRSFTGEDLCEITAHGSPVIARQILSALIEQGARHAEPGEFSRRAFFNGKIGIEEAELISIKANVESAAALRGSELALHEKFSRLRTAYDSLISLIAQVDAEIDFGESDSVEIHDFEERIQNVSASLNLLLQDSANRRENAGYFTVALTGPPNVGKSSLFNALLRHERSLVSETPGTTRDYVESFIDVEGFRVKLIDTAGIRVSNESLESRGIELGRQAATYADITLRLTEPIDRTPSHDDSVLLLHNKVDLDHWTDGLCVSAITGEGINAFHNWLFTELGLRSSELSLVNLSDSERSKLSSILVRLSTLELTDEPAILSEELHSAASELADLLGLNTSSESLDFIFAKMCIGK